MKAARKFYSLPHAVPRALCWRVTFCCVIETLIGFNGWWFCSIQYRRPAPTPLNATFVICSMLSRLQGQKPALQQRSGPAIRPCINPVTQKRVEARSWGPQQQQQSQVHRLALPCQQQQRAGVAMRSAASSPATAAEAQVPAAAERSLICTSITASTVEAFLQEIKEAASTGAAHACV